MLSSFKFKSKELELASVNIVKDTIKPDKATIVSLFDIYFKRKVAEDLEKITELGGLF